MIDEGQPFDPAAPTGASQEADVEAEGQEGQPSEPQRIFVGGRWQTAEEAARNFEFARAEVERWKAVAESAAKARVAQEPESDPLPGFAPKLVEAGVPEPVVKEMVSWVNHETDRRSEDKVARKLQELLEGLSEISSSEGKADAQLAQEFDGYSKQKIDEFLLQNPREKERYDRVFKSDPEAAKRLAWLTITGSSRVSGQPRSAQVPTSKRMPKGFDKDELAALKEKAQSGADADVAAYMKKLFGGRM